MMNDEVPTPDEKETVDPRAIWHPLRLLAGLALLFALYVFSLGPAALMYKKGLVSVVAMQTVYSPLESMPFSEVFLDWYMPMWVK
jgi:hypothetical protein